MNPEKIMFLKWEARGKFLSAKDPLDKTIRWVIRSVGDDQWPQFILVRMTAGSGSEWEIARARSCGFLKWKAALFRLGDITDVIFNASYVVKSKEEEQKILAFLESLTNEPEPSGTISDTQTELVSTC